MLDLLKIIDQQAVEHPDRLAFTSTQGEITYRSLVEDSNRFAQYISTAVSDPQAPVAMIGHKQPELLVGFLGAVKAGHPYIPIDDSYPADRIQRITEIGKPALVLDSEQIKAAVSQTTLPDEYHYASPSSESPWYIIFTSGSTGEPKGVVITAGCLSSFVEWILSEHTFSDGEIFLNQAPFSFDLSVMDLYPCLVSGGTEAAVTRDEIANLKLLYENFKKHSINTWVSTPSFAEMCLVEPGFNAQMLPGLHRFLFCGETLSPDLAKELLARFPAAEVWNTYGPTEATVATTSIQITPEVVDQYNPLPVGYAKPMSEIVVYQPGTNQPAGESERGEIIIAGENVSPGYLARPELTQKSFFRLDGWRAYHTGDWGRIRNGLLFFEGRMDSQIKLHGYRIELGDIEANLCQLEEIKDAVVLPLKKNDKIDSLTAFVILSGPGSQPVVSEFEITQGLKNKLRNMLPTYMIPRKFIYLSGFPLTTNGKADRRKLAEMIQ